MVERLSGNDVFQELDQVPTIEDMDLFYKVTPDIPQDRPFTWYMFVMSADGVGSLLDKTYPDPSVGLSGPGIALKQFRDKRPESIGSVTDFRLLQYLWTAADATVSGTGILKAEPSLLWLPTDRDLIDHYKTLHSGRVPLRVIVTEKGFTAEELSSFRVLHSDGTLFNALIATGNDGLQRMKQEITKIEGGKPTAEIRAYGESKVDMTALMHSLKSDYNVHFVDVQGGPQIAGQGFENGLIDEYRVTYSPAIAGFLTPDHRQRPSSVAASFSPMNLKTMTLIKLGVFGSHIFARYKVHYPTG